MDEKTHYRPLMDRESSDDGSTIDGILLKTHQERRGWRRWCPSVLGASVVFLIAAVVGLTIALLTKKPTDMECTKQLSLYSPALEAVEYHDIDFINDFNSTSIYRGPPTPEREEAWDKLTYKHGIEIGKDKIHLLNRTEADRLKHVPEEVGDGYVAILEVYHQLHCLNMIRMYTWWLVDKYPGVPDGLSMSPLKNRMHVDHCIESLRISLQCWGDVTPLFVRLGGAVGAKADFNTHHRCRNFDKIDQWIMENWTVD